MKTALTDAQVASRSISWGSARPERPHTLSREVNDLRDDIETAMVTFESKTSMPMIHAHTGVIDETTSGADDLEFVGTDLYAGRAKASASFTTNGQALVISSIRPGLAGNFTIKLTADVNAGASTWSVDGSVITCALKRVNGVITATGNGMRTALLANAAVTKLIFLHAPEGAAEPVAAEKALTGGTGKGMTLNAYKLGSADAALSLELEETSDTLIKVQDGQIPAATEDDVYRFELVSHTAKTTPPIQITTVKT